jgi:4'-phosphopantetheinyl transferase EntD
VIDPALRSILPATVAVVTGPVAGFLPPGDPLQALFPEEQAAVARAVPKRLTEYVAGRIAARRALSHLGVTVGALPKGPGGAPLWPPGIAASLSHGGGMVAAIAARTGDIATLGVDLEPLGPRADPLAGAICTPAEAAAARTHAHGILRVFSAKEAAFKALYPLAGTLFGFDALDVTLQDGGFRARLTRPLGPFAADLTIAGGQALAADFVLSAVVLPAEMCSK